MKDYGHFIHDDLACERSFEEKEEHGGFWKNFFGG
jgi:hypothetical protein